MGEDFFLKEEKSVKIWASGGDLSTWRIPTPLVDTATLFLRETIPYLHIYQSDYLPLPRYAGWVSGLGAGCGYPEVDRIDRWMDGCTRRHRQTDMCSETKSW